MKKINKYSKGWISGFIQSDGCFTISLEKRKTGLFLRPKPMIILTQDKCEKNLFVSLKDDLKVGFLRKSKNNIELCISSLYQLKQVMLPILDQHPLKYGKLRSYLLFKKVVNNMISKQHLNLQGLMNIVNIAFDLNYNTTKHKIKDKQQLFNYLNAKHKILPSPAPVFIDDSEIKCYDNNLSLDFITGLIDGDGSFNVSFQLKPYKRVKTYFTIVQEESCRELLQDLIRFFSCGKVYDLPSKAARFQLENNNLILDKIKPILDQTEFKTNKSNYYKMFIEVCNILKNENYKCNSTFAKIVELSYDKNKKGKRRKVNKEELIKYLK